jgi:hypothetical protein
MIDNDFSKETVMSSGDMRQAVLRMAALIAAAYHVAERTSEDARDAILCFLDQPHFKSVPLLTVGELYDLTDWDTGSE